MRHVHSTDVSGTLLLHPGQRCPPEAAVQCEQIPACKAQIRLQGSSYCGSFRHLMPLLHAANGQHSSLQEPTAACCCKSLVSAMLQRHTSLLHPLLLQRNECPLQIKEEFKRFARHVDVRAEAFFGGKPISEDKKLLRSTPACHQLCQCPQSRPSCDMLPAVLQHL